MILVMKTKAQQTVTVREMQMQRERQTEEVRSLPRSRSQLLRVLQAAVRVETKRGTLHAQLGKLLRACDKNYRQIHLVLRV